MSVSHYRNRPPKSGSGFLWFPFTNLKQGLFHHFGSCNLQLCLGGWVGALTGSPQGFACSEASRKPHNPRAAARAKQQARACQAHCAAFGRLVAIEGCLSGAWMRQTCGSGSECAGVTLQPCRPVLFFAFFLVTVVIIFVIPAVAGMDNSKNNTGSKHDNDNNNAIHNS